VTSDRCPPRPGRTGCRAAARCAARDFPDPKTEGPRCPGPGRPGPPPCGGVRPPARFPPIAPQLPSQSAAARAVHAPGQALGSDGGRGSAARPRPGGRHEDRAGGGGRVADAQAALEDHPAGAWPRLGAEPRDGAPTLREKWPHVSTGGRAGGGRGRARGGAGGRHPSLSRGAGRSDAGIGGGPAGGGPRGRRPHVVARRRGPARAEPHRRPDGDPPPPPRSVSSGNTSTASAPSWRTCATGPRTARSTTSASSSSQRWVPSTSGSPRCAAAWRRGPRGRWARAAGP